MHITPNQEKNFHKKYNKKNKDDCWEWLAQRNERGYGKFRIGSSINGTRTISGAHRVSYFLENGPFDYSLLVRHKCDNPCCVNPNHLEIGTCQDNSNDMVKRGRSHLVARCQSGENNANCKLKVCDVAEIKKLLPYKNNKQIALLFGVTHSNISRIRRGLSWADV